MVAPGDGDGFHRGVAGGLEIDGGVTDEGAILRKDGKEGGDFKGRGGIRFEGGGRAVAEDDGEGIRWEEGVGDGDGEGVGLVGEDGKGDAFNAESGEEGGDAGIGAGAGGPGEGVIGREVFQDASL